MTLDTEGCASPKTAIYQSGNPKNCYCANTTCTQTASSWQDTYVHHGSIVSWEKTSHTACAESEMLWLSQHGTLHECEAKAAAKTSGCLSGPTGKTVMYQTGDVKNCYCANATCTKTPTDWLDLYVQPAAPALSQVPTSTGKLYSP